MYFDKRQQKVIEDLCKRFGVKVLYAFGSFLENDHETAINDIDLLIELLPMEPYQRVNAYFGLLSELRQLFDKEVDLVMVDAVKNPYIAKEIDRTKKVIYAA